MHLITENQFRWQRCKLLLPTGGWISIVDDVSDDWQKTLDSLQRELVKTDKELKRSLERTRILTKKFDTLRAALTNLNSIALEEDGHFVPEFLDRDEQKEKGLTISRIEQVLSSRNTPFSLEEIVYNFRARGWLNPATKRPEETIRSAIRRAETRDTNRITEVGPSLYTLVEGPTSPRNLKNQWFTHQKPNHKEQKRKSPS